MKHKILSTVLMNVFVNPKHLISGVNHAQLMYENRLLENYIIECMFFKNRANDKYILELKYPIQNEKIKTYHEFLSRTAIKYFVLKEKSLTKKLSIIMNLL